MSSGPSVKDATALNENDLLPHGFFTLVIHGNETVWVGDVSGSSESPIVTLGMKHLRIMGELDNVLDRLRALVAVVEEAKARPQDWDLLLSRLPSGTKRTWPHPFVNDPQQTKSENA